MTKSDDPRREIIERLWTLNDQLRDQLKARDDFLARLLDPDDLGWAVTDEVRKKVRSFLSNIGH
jgi:hypothetical protein